MDEIRRDLTEGLEDEGSLVESRMRDLEAGLVDEGVAVQKQVEIEDAGAPTNRLPLSVSARPPLDLEQGLEEPARRHVHLDREDCVQVVVLSGWPDGLGLPDP